MALDDIPGAANTSSSATSSSLAISGGKGH